MGNFKFTRGHFYVLTSLFLVCCVLYHISVLPTLGQPIVRSLVIIAILKPSIQPLLRRDLVADLDPRLFDCTTKILIRLELLTVSLIDEFAVLSTVFFLQMLFETRWVVVNFVAADNRRGLD